MFANTNSLVCEGFKQGMEPLTKEIVVGRVQTQVHRRSDSSFWFGDRRGDNTIIAEMNLRTDGTYETKSIEQFMGVYAGCSFGVDHCLLANRQGDLLSWDMVSRETAMQQGQHPNTFHPLQIHPIDWMFVTCGGSMKHQGNHQPMIKLWQPTQTELEMKGKMGTGHSASIETSVVLGRSAIATASSDKSIRSFDLATQQLVSIIPTKVDYFSAAGVDWHSVLFGGISNRLDLVDTRTKRTIKGLPYCKEAVQVTSICRLNSNQYLFSDVNLLYLLDTRKMEGRKVAESKGERITCINVISKELLAVGNSERTLQVWRVY